MELRYHIFHKHPTLVFPALAVICSSLSHPTRPNLFTLVAVLTTLLLYMPIAVNRRQGVMNIFFLWFSLTVGSLISSLEVGISALDSPALSSFYIFLASGFISIITLSNVFTFTRLRLKVQVQGWQLLAFPAMWATSWFLIGRISPIGRFALPSPVTGNDLYKWSYPLFGPVFVDWITASFAVVLSQTIERLVIADKEDEEETLLVDVGDVPSPKPHLAPSYYLLFTLIALSIPSMFTSEVPMPRFPPKSITPLTVACALPSTFMYGHSPLTVGDYVKETQKLAGYTDIILWPEGAATLRSRLEKEALFEQIRNFSGKSLVGVSYEEYYEDAPGSIPKRRHGISIISRYSNDSHMDYYKRHLVPVSESYYFRSSPNEPTVVDLEVQKPTWVNRSEWGGSTRPVAVTASICADLAFDNAFSSLGSGKTDLKAMPALILAPASTWDPSVGLGMWEQAKLRAYELRSMILWCDGGRGGVSGVAGHGFREVVQVGEGSWRWEIGLPYPHDKQHGRAFSSWWVVSIIWSFVLASKAMKGRS